MLFPVKLSTGDLHNRVACVHLLPGSFPDPPYPCLPPLLFGGILFIHIPPTSRPVPPPFKPKDCFPRGQPGLHEPSAWISLAFTAVRVSFILPIDWRD